jgi:hypothetical protein
VLHDLAGKTGRRFVLELLPESCRRSVIHYTRPRELQLWSRVSLSYDQ